MLWSFDLATGLIRWFYGYHYSGSSNSFVSYANSEFTIISPAASANDAGSLKCLPVVGSDWAVQAGTQQSHYFCPPPPGRGPSKQSFNRKLIIYPQKDI